MKPMVAVYTRLSRFSDDFIVFSPARPMPDGEDIDIGGDYSVTPPSAAEHLTAAVEYAKKFLDGMVIVGTAVASDDDGRYVHLFRDAEVPLDDYV